MKQKQWARMPFDFNLHRGQSFKEDQPLRRVTDPLRRSKMSFFRRLSQTLTGALDAQRDRYSGT